MKFEETKRINQEGITKRLLDLPHFEPDGLTFVNKKRRATPQPIRYFELEKSNFVLKKFEDLGVSTSPDRLPKSFIHESKESRISRIKRRFQSKVLSFAIGQSAVFSNLLSPTIQSVSDVESPEQVNRR